MKFLTPFKNVPVENNGCINASKLPGDLIFGKDDNSATQHIIRKADFDKQQDELKTGTSLCGRRCTTDFSMLCGAVDMCRNCLKWMDQCMRSAMYDENEGKWYYPNGMQVNLKERNEQKRM